MKTISLDAINNVNGGNEFVAWVIGEIASYTIGRALKGDIDFVGAMNDGGCGTGYCTLGA